MAMNAEKNGVYQLAFISDGNAWGIAFQTIKRTNNSGAARKNHT
jgi:hypothetical protein